MITFKQITVKNFGSYGNHPTKIDLSGYATTLVVGNNGCGKSTILLDGIFFVLFNRPYRKVTKGQLVNSRNKGDTLVELEFDTRGSTYLVRRGIKPNIFEILKDDVRLDLNVLTKDQQDYLEQDILQLNMRTFGQTAVLGSSSFVPFMQLPAAGRREVVDDVLDVHVYTRMAEIAKEDLSVLLKELSTHEQSMVLMKNSYMAQKELIRVMESGQQDLIDSLQGDMTAILADISDNEKLKDSLQEELLQILDKKVELSVEQTAKKGKLSSLQSKASSVRNKVKDIESLDVCPTCMQSVTDEHKHSIKEKTEANLASLDKTLAELEAEVKQVEKLQLANIEIDNQAQSKTASIKNVKYTLGKLAQDVERLNEKILQAKSNNSDKVESEIVKLKDMAVKTKEIIKTIDELKERKAVLELSVKLLKDNGIKASIIKEYLPTINSLINENLKNYGFDINFSLDENFDETIDSPGRENFTYNSFSEGEKEKIDYSIMLALRAVGASKNATSINLLVLDEILDGSLDTESRSITLDILTRGMEESNVFVISHTESQPSYYERVLRVSRKGLFSDINQE